ncbi:MAG: CHAT domain-containing protein [Pyrinomonadaceae bacterium]
MLQPLILVLNSFENTSANKEESMKVLAVFANPRGTSALRLGEEDRKIQECIRLSKHRDNIQLIIKHAVTIDDVRRALLDDDFDIIHFSGHGTGTGLAFEDNLGRIYVPPRDAVGSLLQDFVPPLQCVLMNACYSTSQGRFTSLGIPFTIAMEGPISDDAAIIFTGGFYDSIGAGKDVEFSFRQGIHALRLAGHADSIVPKILHKGESITIEGEETVSTDGTRANSQPAQFQAQPLLVGIGLDVSGSMKASINNRFGIKQTRLEGFGEALSQGIAKSKGFLESVQKTDAPVDLFAYAFGLRTGDVCDLFSLIRVAGEIISKEEIEELKERYTLEIKRRYSDRSDLGELASLARRFGYGSLVDSATSAARANAETEIRNRILAEVQRRLSAQLQTVGDTTLGINELAELWKGSSSSFADAEGLIFGDTPMCAALRKIENRFRKELKKRADQSLLPILLFVSDGEPTDGEPEELAKQMRDLGVTIICCYITNQDVGEPRTLFPAAGKNWPSGARKMFEMSSLLPEDSPFKFYLLRQGWTIAPAAKTFIQVNRSEILEELVGLALCPIETGYQLLPEGQ